jgi:DNA-binding CsgD family transcriptional regulator
VVSRFQRGGVRYVVAREDRSAARASESLTAREREVVARVAAGQSTKEVAYELGIADVTVRVLLSRAAARLGVGSRAALLAHDDVQCAGQPSRPGEEHLLTKDGAAAPPSGGSPPDGRPASR